MSHIPPNQNEIMKLVQGVRSTETGKSAPKMYLRDCGIIFSIGLGIINLGFIGLCLCMVIGLMILVSMTPEKPGEVSSDFIQITPQAYPSVSGRSMGDPDSGVIVEVFSDFQCPRCSDFAREVMPRLVTEYVATGKVYWIYRHYPFLDDFSKTKESDQAANASMCAAGQERFWDFHDMLFANWNGENQGTFRDWRLIAFADQLGLDMDLFDICFQVNMYGKDIDNDILRASEYLVTGTPSVFVNGNAVMPGFMPTYEAMKQAIEEQINIMFDHGW